MKRMMRVEAVLPAAMVLLALSIAAPLSSAVADDEEPFEVARLFFQLNDTDEDLGIHLVVDGEPWKNLEIDNPGDRRIFHVKTQGHLRRQGLTEFRFESAEPNFEEFSAEAFFRRFREGEYDIEGRGLDGTDYESEVVITHLMPAPPENLRVNAMMTPEDCDEGPVPVVTGPFVITWDPVTTSHPDLGTPGGVPIEVVRYEVEIEREEPTFFKMGADLQSAATTQYEVPASVFSPGDLVKFQILVQGGDETGMENETSSESCFEVAGP